MMPINEQENKEDNDTALTHNTFCAESSYFCPVRFVFHVFPK